MPNIVTITFSPSIDKSTSVAELISEKKLKCAPPKLEAGGGGVNIARAIKKLGGVATAVFPSGGYTGKFFNYLLKKEEVPTVIIEVENETKENFVVLEEFTSKQYRFGMPSNALSLEEVNQILYAVSNIKNPKFIIASGSLPPGVPVDIYADLSKIAKKSGAKFIVDTSGEALKHAFNEGAYLIKPNLLELATLAGLEKIEVKDVERVAKELINKNTCEVIVVSLGADGAMLITKNEAHLVEAPKVEAKSTVGAGDSMVAGMVYALSKGFSFEKVLQYGVACGSAATMNRGTELCKKEDVEVLMSVIRGQVSHNLTPDSY